MARQVLPLVGAVAGFAVGGPTGAQIGFALGSLVGNAVDPIEMQGRKLGDSPVQTAAEGGARAIVYGKGCIRATCIIERGGRRVIKQRDSSGGKGGGPTTINERALWTFAIGLGEPVAGLLRIWENEKLVYDVTPTSAIPEDTADFAEKFRFYTGAEDQLPDPALEALHGDETPYYRGTAYLVFPQYDLTDFGETVPTYRVEVVSDQAASPTTFMVHAYGEVRYSGDGISYSSWIDSPITGSFITGLNGKFAIYASAQDFYTTEDGASFTAATGASASPSGGWGSSQAALSGVEMVSAGGPSAVRVSLDSAGSFSTGGTPATSIATVVPLGAGWLGVQASRLYTLPADGSSAVESYSAGIGPAFSVAWSDGEFARIGGSLSAAPAVWRTGDGEEITQETLPSFVSATQVTAIGRNPNTGRWLIGTDSGELAYKTGVGWSVSDTSLPFPIASIASNGQTFVVICQEDVITSAQTEAWHGDGITFDQAWSEVRVDSGVNVAASSFDSTVTPENIPLSSIIAALHERAGHGPADYDVAELTEEVAGVVIESTVTGAEAINSIIGSHFADPSDYDGQIHYIKRGKAVVLTLTEDDLIDEPETAQRNNSIEYPKKVHFLGQRADLAYASSKSTSSRYSSDAQVVGEVTVGSPETFDDGTEPAEIAVKLHKVLWEEAIGEQELVIPDNFLGLVPTDCVGFAYREQLNRYRILNIEDTPGQRKLRMIKDRQSAYTANLTEIPNPPPVTPPQSSVVAPTVMAFIDSSALTDNADTLHYLVALSGANENWAGAVLQQQLGGAFTSIDSTTLNSIMGTLQNTVSDASPYYTDTTNTVVVSLFTDDELESRTDAEFLSNGGAFFLGFEDSGETVWEIMQFRDATQDSNGDWVLSHLMRGRKNTPTNEHVPGSMFVWIDPSILREPAQSSWIGTELVHRAVSNGQSPELADIQTNEYVGNSQREWPVADLLLTRPTGTSVEAEAIPRHRFGTSMNPIRSINWDGYQWTATDGVNTINRTGTSAIETFDTTGWASPVTVTVAQLNRITGAGPSVSEDIV